MNEINPWGMILAKLCLPTFEHHQRFNRLPGPAAAAQPHHFKVEGSSPATPGEKRAKTSSVPFASTEQRFASF